jgi:sulfhydrogenase subunit beta (sulfur reductase)
MPGYRNVATEPLTKLISAESGLGSERSKMPGNVVSPEAFDTLIPLLTERGYTVIAPTLDEDTIVYGEIADATDLPIGWTDEQEAGSYRIRRRDDDAYFGFTVGPRTLKTYLFPPKQTLLTIEHAETGLRFCPRPPEPKRYAFVGVRACELAAVDIQDSVFDGPQYPDPHYQGARARSLTVAVNCSIAGQTCFCSSMGAGPRCESGYDIVVTEILDPDRHEFIVEAATAEGSEVIEAIGGRQATPEDAARVDAVVADTVAHMGREMPMDETYALLQDKLEHEIWDNIAERCLSCTNCTLVCPTCFCSTMVDATDLAGAASRERRWDSCFSHEFTYLHGHPVRSSTLSRYRQWMTHKLSYWYDQFGTSGCVGCGRCITWCPVGIDITAEIKKLEEATEVLV